MPCGCGSSLPELGAAPSDLRCQFLRHLGLGGRPKGPLGRGKAWRWVMRGAMDVGVTVVGPFEIQAS